ncbi:MAG: acetate--CoA ligase family protein [Gammaproteobacteria bacterium]|nr:acetate--CoA ligase family protein [Gammaproteobacteria bacterium]
MSSHPLDPLLKPRSIALVGASDKPDSPGFILADMVINSTYTGDIYPVNPRCESINGLTCYPTLESLPNAVDHVVLALSNLQLESALQAAIHQGAKAVTIYSSGILDEDTHPPLLARLTSMARDAGIAICGANGMGFYNVHDDLHVGIFPKSANIQKGGISYIAQSGSAFTALCHNGCRLGFNLCVSSGNEMSTTVADYMDWSLEQSDTKVIGLFLEAVRDPEAFVAALQKALNQDIPVVILKIGKSPLSAEMALTHTGAVAGNHAAFEALYRRYGVIPVDDFDEMAAVLMLLQNNYVSHPGALATIQESGGFRELVADIAHEQDVEFAEIGDSTKDRIQTFLDPGLKAENPLDIWGTHDNFENRFLSCITHLMEDPKVAGGVFFSNFRDGYFLSEAIYRVVQAVAEKTGKPIALGNCYSDLSHDNLCRRGYQQGIPIIDGIRETLLAFKHLFAYQTFKKISKPSPANPGWSSHWIENWRKKLAEQAIVSESEALPMLADFGVTTPAQVPVNDNSSLLDAAKKLNFPLVLKTAEAGIQHKSDAGGVMADIRSERELLEHYCDLSQRLGPSALLTEMVDKGTEVGLGIINDPQFGPMIMVAAGGIFIEFISDRAVALCPVSAEEADELLATLEIDKLLSGVRGSAPGNRQALIEMIVKLSWLAFELRDVVGEIDINPVIVNEHSAIAADALVITRCNSPDLFT